MSNNIHMLAGAYALDALPLEERAFFERHLATCQLCQEEVAGYRETATRLGVAVSETPPPDMRERVLAQAARTRQQSPTRTTNATFQQRLRPLLAPVAAALAAIVMALGGVATYLWQVNQDLSEQVVRAQVEQELPELLPVAQVTRLQAPEGAAATFVHSNDHDRGVLVVNGLPPLEADQDYQLWLFHDGTPVSGGVLRVDDDGVTTFEAEAPVNGAEQVAVTVERAGGVEQPQGPVVMSGELPRHRST